MVKGYDVSSDGQIISEREIEKRNIMACTEQKYVMFHKNALLQNVYFAGWEGKRPPPQVNCNTVKVRKAERRLRALRTRGSNIVYFHQNHGTLKGQLP